jgi:uncharacterized protein YndB with AHSA1/START domain
MLKGLISILMTAALIVGSVVAVGAVVGMTLPEAHQASRSARFGAAPAKVFSVITAVDRYPDWRSDVAKVDILSESKENLRFAEHNRESQDVITYRVEEYDPPALFKIRVDDESLPFGGTWTYVVQPFESGTSVTITEDGMISNPLFRVIAKVMFSPTDSMDRYLHDLAAVESLGGRH